MGVNSTRSIYLVLKPEYARWGGSPRGFFVSALRKTKPALDSGEVAVKVELSLDLDIFANFIPVVSAEIQAPDLIVPEVSVETAEDA